MEPSRSSPQSLEKTPHVHQWTSDDSVKPLCVFLIMITEVNLSASSSASFSVHSWVQRIFFPTRSTKTNLANPTRGKDSTRACGRLRTTPEWSSPATRSVGASSHQREGSFKEKPFTINILLSAFLIKRRVVCSQAIQQQSSAEMEEGGNAADGSSEGEEGDSVEEEDDKEKLKGDKTGSKRKKTASSKVPSFRQRSSAVPQ